MLNPARIRVLAVGKVRKAWVREGLETYRRRLPGLTLVDVRDSTPEREAAAILAELRGDEQLIALGEEGRGLSSQQLAERLRDSGSRRLAFVIGGADGLSPGLRRRAAWQLSLSPLTFPHDLARLLLLEQLYRAQSILQGGPYHRA
ncbi:MAG: 23S rRNA (pseudouridine(1915)-N(3))-methyltransferase RlmH [Cyanobium sp.]|nr:23S rRNA (pseudouridine(1915)-N(3))-methyltransferase RlmH [Cyanobium sp.]